jgi:hypothetical protein
MRKDRQTNRRRASAVVRDVNAWRLAETRRISARWLKRLSHSSHSDSAALIRQDRDAR